MYTTRLREGPLHCSVHAHIKIPDNTGWQDGCAQGSTLLPDAGILTTRDALFQVASAASVTRPPPLLARHWRPPPLLARH